MLQHILQAGCLVRLVAALNFSVLASSPGNETQQGILQSGTPPCNALAAAGLKNRLLLPTDADYELQIQTWWAKNSRLRPWCLVLPQNSKELSLVMTTLTDTGHGAGDWHIALRSGGHSLTGTNNIANGVTIDLSMMNSSHYDKTTNIASVEPGGRWEHVYANLQDQGVTVAGGRDGDVGVGGFLLGGGLSFFTGKLGFGCDSVTNYEVVLANGTIINANNTTNSDLWRALKGGSSNFGIVTRYDMEAIPTRDIYRDLRFMATNYSDIAVDTVVDFANHDESLGDNALVTWFSHNTAISQDTTIGTIYVNTLGNATAETSFDNLRRLPALLNITTRETMADAASSSKVAPGKWVAQSTRTFKNDPAILRYCFELHEEYIQTLKQSIRAENFTTMMFLQPLPSYVGRIGQQRGGNMLGLEGVADNAVIWTGGVSVDLDEASLALAQAGLDTMSAQIKHFAQSVDGLMDLIYLNYADLSQDPLGSYGADQVQYMRNVAAKYDPTGTFQRRIPGGFKIDRVL